MIAEGVDEVNCLAIFDHDGVLVDTLEFHQRAWQELGNRTGLPFTVEFIHETFGMTNPSILARLPGVRLSDEAMARLGDTKEALYREVARDRLKLMPGVRVLLDELTRTGVLLGIGSSGPRANLELTIERCGLTGRFSAIVSLEDITRGKPDPEVFLIAARQARVAPRRCVVFEDAPVGIQAAKAAGMLAIGVGTTHALADLSAAGADAAVSSLVGYDPKPWFERLSGEPGSGTDCS